MYRDANLVLESQDSDKLEKHTKELFKIAQLYYAEQSKRRPSTNIKVINLVCNLLSSNRQVQRAMTFAVNTDTSTVNGYSANINENSIAYEYSSQDGTKYKVNIDRISGFGVIGTAQFPLLMSGPCNKVEGKAF